MRNLTKVVNQTPFKNDTFQFYATEKHDELRDFYYTPYSITNWRFENGYTWASMNMFTHDISHMLDIYLRGREEQLLINDFGWKLTSDSDKVPHAFGYTELRTTVLQHFLRHKVMKRMGINFNNPSFKRYWRHRCGKDFLPTKELWEAHTNKLFEEINNNGINYYIGKWQNICEYVKENRN